MVHFIGTEQESKLSFIVLDETGLNSLFLFTCLLFDVGPQNVPAGDVLHSKTFDDACRHRPLP